MYNADVDNKQLAAAFRALGDPTRLAIFYFLRGCATPVVVEENGDVRPVSGPTVGEVCCHVTGIDKITSTVSFHLKELRNAGLIAMEKRGKNMICCVNPETVKALRVSLDDCDCCEKEN